MIELKPQRISTDTYAVRCQHCGKFISRKDIEEQKAKFHFIPDNEFGPEESYWEHVTC